MATFKSFKDAFNKQRIDLSSMKKSLPTQIGNKGQNFFRASFENQGFTDKSLQRWKDVQRRVKRRGTRASRFTEAILVQSGNLRRAVGDSLQSASFDLIKFSVSTPYAIYHNEGTGKIPQRQFVGQSYTLEQQVREMIVKAFGKALG